MQVAPQVFTAADIGVAVRGACVREGARQGDGGKEGRREVPC